MRRARARFAVYLTVRRALLRACRRSASNTVCAPFIGMAVNALLAAAKLVAGVLGFPGAHRGRGQSFADILRTTDLARDRRRHRRQTIRPATASRATRGGSRLDNVVAGSGGMRSSPPKHLHAASWPARVHPGGPDQCRHRKEAFFRFCSTKAGRWTAPPLKATCQHRSDAITSFAAASGSVWR